MKYLATFFTHAGAIKYRRYLQQQAIAVELRPTPRELSSNCGIAGLFCLAGDISQFISEDMEKIFVITEKGYQLVYENA